MSEIRSKEYKSADLLGGEMTISRHYPRNDPSWGNLSARERLAWRLRWFADKIDGGLSYRLSGRWPAGMTDEDMYDALGYGAAGMLRYMIDLQKERNL